MYICIYPTKPGVGDSEEWGFIRVFLWSQAACVCWRNQGGWGTSHFLEIFCGHGHPNDVPDFPRSCICARPLFRDSREPLGNACTGRAGFVFCWKSDERQTERGQYQICMFLTVNFWIQQLLEMGVAKARLFALMRNSIMMRANESDDKIWRQIDGLEIDRSSQDWFSRTPSILEDDFYRGGWISFEVYWSNPSFPHVLGQIRTYPQRVTNDPWILGSSPSVGKHIRTNI